MAKKEKKVIGNLKLRIPAGRATGASHLRQQDLAGFEVGKLEDRLGVEELALENASLDSQEWMCLCEVAQSLGHLGDVAGDEGKRSGADERRFDTLDSHFPKLF